MTHKAIFAGVLLAALPGLAFAQGGRGMMRADANRDGMISRGEATVMGDQRFATMDANHDGVLSADEMTGPGARAPGARAMTRAAGESMTKAQYDGVAAKRFERMDSNGDGVISADEINALVAARAGGKRGGGAIDPADAVMPPPAPAAPQNPGQ